MDYHLQEHFQLACYSKGDNLLITYKYSGCTVRIIQKLTYRSVLRFVIINRKYYTIMIVLRWVMLLGYVCYSIW